MTFKKHIQSIFVAFIIFFNGCAEGEWELLEVDYEPVLNVFGLISLDPEVDSFVRVYRTITLSEESEIFVGVDTFVFGEEVYLDSIYEPAGLIKNAQVSIKANGTSIPFNFVPKQYSWEWNQKNIYLDTLGTFTPKPGTTYLLNVTVPGYDSVKGELLTPEIPVLIDSLIQDTCLLYTSPSPRLFGSNSMEVRDTFQGDQDPGKEPLNAIRILIGWLIFKKAPILFL